MRWLDGVVRGGRRGPTVAALVLAGCAVLAACGGSATGAKTGAGLTTRPVSATGRATVSPSAAGPAAGDPHAARLGGPPLVSVPPAPSALPVAPGAGSLGQTNAFPSTKTTAFRNAMYDLWLAVTTGDPGLARPAFFPEAAYTQVKGIADPQYDWQYRLWYDFTLDVKAVHPLIGRDARLISVIVPAQYAAWVYPGACYNNVGYWHAPGARVVYRQGGETRSFGIASLISWRGDWYVIHFGAVLRGGDYGEVDDPETGSGTPGPPGGC